MPSGEVAATAEPPATTQNNPSSADQQTEYQSWLDGSVLAVQVDVACTPACSDIALLAMNLESFSPMLKLLQR